MDLSKLSAGDRRTLIVAALVALIGIISIADRWGFGAILGFLGGLIVVGVLLLPQLSPATKLPVTKGLGILAGGGLAAIGFLIAGLTWFSYMLDFTGISNIIFDIGLVLAFVLAWFGWQAYQAERPASATPAAATPAPTTPPGATAAAPPPPPATTPPPPPASDDAPSTSA